LLHELVARQSDGKRAAPPIAKNVTCINNCNQTEERARKTINSSNYLASYLVKIMEPNQSVYDDIRRQSLVCSNETFDCTPAYGMTVEQCWARKSRYCAAPNS